MFIAHIGVGLAAKRVAPRASLGVLLLSSQLLDILCGVFVVTGLERMKVSPGITRMTPLEFISYPWSHGLFMSVVWSGMAAIIAARFYRDRGTGLVVGALVFSHWVLDWISHRPDLPLLFDGSPKVGLGLWNNPAGTMIFEFILFAIGVFVILSYTRPLDRTGTWSFVGFAIFFPVLFLLNHFGPPPPVDIPQQLMALPIFVFVVLLPWGNWIDRHRVARV
ncbi:MAG: hypothetical protein WC889_20165 [Myxococcota bacterium]|jgi:hypothetical protein